MNRLILIGNGFDLAHGMKTSYNDFILWYLKKCFSKANNKNVFEDDLIEITKTHNSWQNYMNNVSELVDYFYKTNLVGLFKDTDLYIKFNASDYIFQNPFRSKIKSVFFERLITNCSNSNWVNIENEFYLLLKSLLPSINDHNDFKISQLKPLNDSLKSIIKELNSYLIALPSSVKLDDYFEICSSLIYAKDICTKILKADEEVKETVVLNFNYTTTPKKYLTGKLIDTEINYIHGKD